MTTCVISLQKLFIYRDYSCLGEEQGHSQQESPPQRGNIQVNVEIVAHQVMEKHQQLMYADNSTTSQQRFHHQQVQQALECNSDYYLVSNIFHLLVRD